MNRPAKNHSPAAVKMDKALMELLERKPFESITVSELCAEAGVHRSTFYLHYENITDLLDETIRYLLDGFLDYFEPELWRFTENLAECDLADLNFICDKYLVPYLAYVRDNHETFMTAHLYGSTFGLEIACIGLYERVFTPILDRFHYPREDQMYVTLYYVRGIHAITIEWLREDCARPVEDIVSIIRTCVFGLNREDPFA